MKFGPFSTCRPPHDVVEVAGVLHDDSVECLQNQQVIGACGTF